MDWKVRQGADMGALGTGRPVAMGTRGAVASAHYLASQVGRDMLMQGGSAVDAAIGINATLCVVLNHMTGLGGDLFCQIWDEKSQKLVALNGSGRAGRNATIDLYRAKGIDKIPERGPLAAVTVPGVVDAWWQMHSRYGRLEWAELFAPAIRYAEEGFPISERFRNSIAVVAPILRRCRAAADVYLRDDRAPSAGDLFVQRDLARSLRLIAENGPDVFYRGELAELIAKGLQEEGSFLTREDFAEHRSDWVEPISTTYRGLTVTQLPPNTQGMAALIILNILEGYDLNAIGDNTADYYHLMAEATKLAYGVRDRWVTDPASLDIPIGKLISKETADELRERIRWESALSLEEARIPMGGDTAYMCAADGDGNVCSLIQSLYFGFGSAVMPRGTGLTLQNRGSFFSLDPDHPNRLEPGKRTLHTLMPAMALKNGRPYICYGTMGGEGQPQTQAALVTRIVDFGYNMQQAIEAPRWLYGRTWGEASQTLELEGRVPDYVLNNLKTRGHTMQMAEDWCQKMGHAQGIVFNHETGVMQAGADPRGDGTALAW